MGTVTDAQKKIVRDTLPLVKQHILMITTHFYQSIFDSAPQAHYLFNMSHQKQNDGTPSSIDENQSYSQPRAIANSIVCVASHLDQIEMLLGSQDGQQLIGTIVSKHVACQIPPTLYGPVGGLLLNSVKTVLSKVVELDDITWDNVLDAWGAFYGMVADLLMSLESKLMNDLRDADGGWVGGRDFIIVDKQVHYPNSSQGRHYDAARISLLGQIAAVHKHALSNTASTATTPAAVINNSASNTTPRGTMINRDTRADSVSTQNGGERQHPHGVWLTLTLQSADQLPVICNKPGDYITLRIRNEELKIDTLRHYTVYNKAEKGGNIYQIAISVIDGGLVSNYLLNHTQVGHKIEIHPPVGTFGFDDELVSLMAPVLAPMTTSSYPMLQAQNVQVNLCPPLPSRQVSTMTTNQQNQVHSIFDINPQRTLLDDGDVDNNNNCLLNNHLIENTRSNNNNNINTNDFLINGGIDDTESSSSAHLIMSNSIGNQSRSAGCNAIHIDLPRNQSVDTVINNTIITPTTAPTTPQCGGFIIAEFPKNDSSIQILPTSPSCQSVSLVSGNNNHQRLPPPLTAANSTMTNQTPIVPIFGNANSTSYSNNPPPPTTTGGFSARDKLRAKQDAQRELNKMKFTDPARYYEIKEAQELQNLNAHFNNLLLTNQSSNISINNNNSGSQNNINNYGIINNNNNNSSSNVLLNSLPPSTRGTIVSGHQQSGGLYQGRQTIVGDKKQARAPKVIYATPNTILPPLEILEQEGIIVKRVTKLPSSESTKNNTNTVNDNNNVLLDRRASQGSATSSIGSVGSGNANTTILSSNNNGGSGNKPNVIKLLFLAYNSSITPYLAMCEELITYQSRVKAFRQYYAENAPSADAIPYLPDFDVTILHFVREQGDYILKRESKQLQQRSPFIKVIPIYYKKYQLLQWGAPSEFFIKLLHYYGQGVLSKHIFVVGPHAFLKNVYYTMTKECGYSLDQSRFEFLGPRFNFGRFDGVI